jgi:hypothetical protein
MDKVALGQVFSEYFGFPCQFTFHRLLHTHHLSSGAGTIDQLVAAVASGPSLTPPQETPQKTTRIDPSYSLVGYLSLLLLLDDSQAASGELDHHSYNMLYL